MSFREEALQGLRGAALIAAAVVLPCCSGDVGQGDVFSTVTIRVSETAKGVEGNAASIAPALSADGMTVAFGSFAHNITPNDSNGFADILIKDRRTGLLENITNVNLSANNLWPGNSKSPDLSADGRYVAFLTLGKFQAEGIPISPVPAVWRPYLHDRMTGKFVEVVGPGGVHLDHDTSELCLSADGRYMVLATSAANTGYSNSTGRYQVYYCDMGPNRDTPVLTLISYVAGSPTQISNGTQSVWPGSISADGEVVVFESSATDILPAQDADPGPDMYYWRRSTGALALASAGSTPKKTSMSGSVSRDGTTVAYFHADSTLFPAPNFKNCELVDLGTGQRRMISDPTTSVEPNTPVSLSGDGRRVTYGATIDGVYQQILFIDGVGNQLLAQSTNGATSSVMVQRAVLSQDGRWAAWFTDAANMVTDDTNGLSDIFIRGPF